VRSTFLSACGILIRIGMDRVRFSGTRRQGRTTHSSLTLHIYLCPHHSTAL
jgi:hypothetical protein